MLNAQIELAVQSCMPCRFYVTPKSFLGMLALFSSLLGEQHSQLTTSRERLLNGLNKLHETNSAVDGMQKELTALQPTLQQKTASAELLLAQVHCSTPQPEYSFFLIQQLHSSQRVLLTSESPCSQAS